LILDLGEHLHESPELGHLGHGDLYVLHRHCFTVR
jgi:hypothetical protein